MLLNTFDTRTPSQLREIGPEHHLPLPRGVRKRNQLVGVILGQISTRVDVHILMLPGDRDHLGRPRVANMSGDDLELGELQRDGVDVGDGAASLAGTQGARVADLRAEWDVELNALHEQRPIVRVRRRQVPQPGHDAQTLEPFVDDVVRQLCDRGDRVVQVHRRQPEDARRVRPCIPCDVGVREDLLARPPP